MITTRSTLTLLSMGVVATGAYAAPKKAKSNDLSNPAKPNVLIIYADDLGS